jgi:hypothetical protein
MSSFYIITKSMGTNYYRIPKASEIEQRKERLKARIDSMPAAPVDVERTFRFIDNPEDEWSPLNPWDEFIEGTSIHLGKRSGGWKFCWNFHDNKYYKDRDSLLDFIRSGRVVDEYGEAWNVEEFINMALEWGQPDGLVADKEYFNTTNHHHWMSNPEDYYDREIDGLRVSSSTEFS